MPPGVARRQRPVVSPARICFQFSTSDVHPNRARLFCATQGREHEPDLSAVHDYSASSLDTPSGSGVIDVASQVIGGALAALSTSPWLAIFFGLLVVTSLIQKVRAVVHGGHRKDPLRRFSGSVRAEIFARAGQRCEQHSWLVGRCRQTQSLQADHIHPHSRGGATALANGQALCRRHNKRKAARIPWNWELARLARRREAYFPAGVPRNVIRHAVVVSAVSPTAEWRTHSEGFGRQ